MILKTCMHVSVSIIFPRNIQSCNVLSSFQVMCSGNLSKESLICESLQNTTTIDKNKWIINISSTRRAREGPKSECSRVNKFWCRRYCYSWGLVTNSLSGKYRISVPEFTSEDRASFWYHNRRNRVILVFLVKVFRDGPLKLNMHGFVISSKKASFSPRPLLIKSSS